MQIAADEIHLWLLREQQVLDDKDLLPACQALLSAEERLACQRFLSASHRRQFLLGRALLRSALAEYMAVADPAALRFSSNAHGKPALVSPPAVSFNLSHAKGLAALAVTAAGPDLGVDLECPRRKINALKLARRYFSASETAALEKLDAAARQERFCDLWTLKEAYIKAKGEGLPALLKDCRFQIEADRIEATFAPACKDDPARWQFWQFQPWDSCKLALALRDKGDKGPGDYRITARAGLPLRSCTELPLQAVRVSRNISPRPLRQYPD